MRKLMLASAAAIGALAGTTGIASAQAPAAAPALAPAQGMILQAPSGGGAANNNNNYQPAMLPGPFANPTPGSMVVRFNGAIWNEFTMAGGNGFQTPASAAQPGGAKLAPYALQEYFRLYPGVDAMAANGLRYGGQAEIRENFSTAGNSTSSNSSSAFLSGQTLYVRRMFGYFAGDRWGMIRLGEGDGVNGIFDNGVTTFQNYDTGAWNGDTPAAIPGNVAITFPFFSQQGAEYGSDKAVYLSPQFYGLDFGFQWAPNNANGEFTCGVAGTGCTTLSSGSSPATASASDGARYTNMYVVGARYQGTFGPVSLYSYATYTGSGAVDFTGTVAPGTVPVGSGGTYNGKFNGMSVGQGGVVLTVAGLSVGGNVTGGAFNGAMALQPQGGSTAVVWLGGVQYATGPIVVGASYYNYQSQGAVNLTNVSQRYEDGLNIGGTYNLAPGLWFYGQYGYEQRHQGDFNFITATAGSSANNNVHAQVLLLGTKVRW